MAVGKITKTEWVLLGLTAAFLSGLLYLAAGDRAEMAQGAVKTERQAAQESFMPEWKPLNLNEADAQALTQLPGIGEELARRIVEYREKNGRFEKVEELMQVSGIGEAKFAALEEQVTVENEEVA